LFERAEAGWAPTQQDNQGETAAATADRDAGETCMRNQTSSLLLAWFALTGACATDEDPEVEPHTEASTQPDAGDAQPDPLTYYQDMLPVFEQHCLQRHREGGIAPSAPGCLMQFGAASRAAG
jgi:hypothetical protein